MLTVTYCTYSETIRQYPQNYVLASFRDNRWVMEPDLAADKRIVVALTLSLMEHENKRSKNGVHAIMGMAPYIDENFDLNLILNK